MEYVFVLFLLRLATIKLRSADQFGIHAFIRLYAVRDSICNWEFMLLCNKDNLNCIKVVKLGMIADSKNSLLRDGLIVESWKGKKRRIFLYDEELIIIYKLQKVFFIINIGNWKFFTTICMLLCNLIENHRISIIFAKQHGEWFSFQTLQLHHSFVEYSIDIRLQ